jgi:hypothetical protein
MAPSDGVVPCASVGILTMGMQRRRLVKAKLFGFE